MVSGFHSENISCAKDIGGAGVLPVDLNAVFGPGKAGNGMGGKVKFGSEDMTYSGAFFFRCDGF